MNNCSITEIGDFDRTRKSFVSIANSTVGTLNAYGEVHLDNSNVTTFPADLARAPYVVWHLPLFGEVLVPYSWTPYILPIIITVIAVLILIILLALYLIRRRSNQHIGNDQGRASFR